MLWFGIKGFLPMLDRHLCAVNNRKKQDIFMHTTFDFPQKVKNKEWQKIKKAITNFASRDVNVFDCGKVFINRHVNNSHYVLYTIFIEEQFIGYYDSLNFSLPSAFPFESVIDWLQHEWEQHSDRIANPLIPFDRKGWKFERVKVVKQQNGVDCAFHVIRNTLLLQMDLPLLEYEVVPPTLSLFLTIFLKC